MNASRGSLGYGFVPVPIRAVQALRDGRLSYDEFALIAYLYSRASWAALCEGQDCLTCTLHQLAAGIASIDLPDTLSKRLRRLRDKPDRWFDYTIQGRNRYRFRLFPREPGPSDVRPSSAGDGDRYGREPTQHARPRSMSECPSSAVRGSGSQESVGAEGGRRRVRDPQTFQKDTSATSEGWTLDPSLETDSAIPWLPEVRDAIEADRAAAREPRAAVPYDPEAEAYARRIRHKFGRDLHKGLPPEDEEQTL